MNKYSDPTIGNSTQYINLPVESFNKITWRAGDDKLSMLLDTDPGQYLGEFRSMVSTTATQDKPSIVFPVLPWKVVTRRAGRDTYQRYSTTEMLFRPIAARSRFVKYERGEDSKRVKGENGRNKITATSKEFPGKGSGYDPQKEVFGYVINEKGEQCTFGLLVLDTWNAYITYNNAAKAFENAKVPEGKLPILKIGTRGEIVNGETFPKVKKLNGGSFVEIEALDLNNVATFDITPDFDEMWEVSQAWAKCERWNTNGKPTEESALPPMPEPSEEFPFGVPEAEL